MQKLARHPHASAHFAELMGRFGQATNALSFLFSLLGTRSVAWRGRTRATECCLFITAPCPSNELTRSSHPTPILPSYVVRTLGLPATLRIFPCLLIVASIAAFLYPYLGVRGFCAAQAQESAYTQREIQRYTYNTYVHA